LADAVAVARRADAREKDRAPPLLYFSMLAHAASFRFRSRSWRLLVFIPRDVHRDVERLK
jgi:hypothetical protein